MTDTPIIGRELASRLLPSGDQLLMASFVQLSDGEAAVHLAAARIEQDGSISLPSTPFAFEVNDVGKVRAIAIHAAEVLPYAQFDQDDWCALGRDGDLVATAARHPRGGTFASVGWFDGSGACVLPAESVGLFAEVLAAAERQLAGEGLVTLSSDLTN